MCYSAQRQGFINRRLALSRNRSLVGWTGKETKD